MMIDCHVHTFYSKHATGTVDEVVRAALAKGVNVLTFTDHAPFHVDSLNRLLESELDQYFDDIERAQTEYRGQIKILRGLELDYLPGASDYTARMLARYDLDFAIGSIHYISMADGDEVKVWELARLNNPAVLKRYFSTLAELLECGLFDAVGHADTLLRGVSSPVVHRYVEPLLPAFARHNIAFELNASGLRKTTLDLSAGREVHGKWSYPSLSLLPLLLRAGAAFTIGSDSHTPEDVGAGVQEVVDALIPLGLKTVSYFEGRQRVDIQAASLTTPRPSHPADPQQ
ncbi:MULTISPECIES: histidinol-phosphatase [Paraburkholderia]|uniref:Histidinol-phosphatase n=1 Tax=Paraburkholderia nemoris TaxID=2793076 RepID=A0ABM8T4Y2_9BURK|nr:MULTISPECIES: histidinol-phosphatase [Paraburkholderia]MCI0151307.1 histidinol-phosphatase HisJ family protein [Paraburkholderia sediminicola]CAE6807208.1 Histidinol-phosphatase [Paraburkholderia domus]CAE6842386.1 Histidinol-phosphatase [Paraburkholderia domus]CAE6855891.1 Histidinol-phosphatase [Paraburkholderia nemoris]CAE6859616.1 Histidinol-phosphatase [Paraburkholderia nemoris]